LLSRCHIVLVEAGLNPTRSDIVLVEAGLNPTL